MIADGRSLFTLKSPWESESLPVVTNVPVYNVTWRLFDILHYPYGIGVSHDQYGFVWSETPGDTTLKDLLANGHAPAHIESLFVNRVQSHPAHFLNCDKLEAYGNASRSVCYAAAGLAFLALFMQIIGVTLRIFVKVPALILHFIITLCFVCLVGITSAIFDSDWSCGQDLVPKLVFKDHFRLSYMTPFLVIAAIAALINIGSPGQ